jgi:hypothetical protein
MTVEERYKKYMDLGKDDIEKRKKTLDTQADEDIKTINTAADDAVKSINESYGTQITDTKESYNDAFRKNEVQVRLNERYLERKAAEMGLTDSGMNRTQMTANQLSYGNTNAKIVADRQKAVDALTAAMQSKIADINAKRSSDIADINRTLNANKANVDSSYSDWARQQAVDDYNEDIKVKNEDNKVKDEKLTQQQKDFDALWKSITGDQSDDYKLWLIDQYVIKYDADIDSREMLSLFNDAGLTLDQYEKYVLGEDDDSNDSGIFNFGNNSNTRRNFNIDGRVPIITQLFR